MVLKTAVCEIILNNTSSIPYKYKVPCFVVLDNASIHCSGAFMVPLKKYQQGGCFLTFFPPDSPELNLIEMLWRKVKYEWLPLDAYQSYIANPLYVREGQIIKLC